MPSSKRPLPPGAAPQRQADHPRPAAKSAQDDFNEMSLVIRQLRELALLIADLGHGTAELHAATRQNEQRLGAPAAGSLPIPPAVLSAGRARGVLRRS